MMRRFVVILVVVVILGVLGVGAFLMLRGGKPQVVVLPNGTRIELLGVAVGGKTFTTEKSWHKQARRFLPRRWQSMIPSPLTGSCGNGTNSFTIYLQARNATGGNVKPWEYYTAQDDTGFTYPQNGGYCSFGGGTPAGATVYGLTFRAFPRRQTRFTFRLLDAQSVEVAKFEVQNPVPASFPEWQSLPLPQKQTNGPVVVTLEKLIESGGTPYRYIHGQWRVSATETNWSKARTRYLTLFDASGNEGQWLSRREKAWKVRTQVFRERLQDFLTTEYVALTNVPVPEPGQNVLSLPAIERNGVKILVQALGGRGSITNENNTGWFMVPGHPGATGQSSRSSGNTSVEEWSSMKPFLLMDVQNVQSSDEIRVQIRDDQGREIKIEDSGYSARGTTAGQTRTYMRRFDPAPDAKFLNLEIIVNRPLEFEFMVNPADVQSKK